MNHPPLVALVDHLARGIVDEPDAVAVSIQPSTTRDGWVLELRVASADLGKVIGREGATARALRTVLATAAGRLGTRAILNVVENR